MPKMNLEELKNLYTSVNPDKIGVTHQSKHQSGKKGFIPAKNPVKTFKGLSNKAKERKLAKENWEKRSQ